MRRSLTNNARFLARKSAILLVVLQFATFPALYYSQSHLHYFLGVYVSHWHPLAKGQQSDTAQGGPLAHHKHSLRELLTIHASQGSPAVQIPVQEVAFFSLPQELIPLPAEIILPQNTVAPGVARAPPCL